MKIRRAVVSAENNSGVEEIKDKEPVLGYEFSGKYGKAQDHIMQAVKELSEIAKTGDEIAKDSIANLSVVLLDLQRESEKE